MDGLPAPLAELLQHEAYQADTVGKSHSRTLLFSDKVLKIQPAGVLERNEAGMLTWLRGRLSVPEVLYCGEADGTQYLLMTRMKGTMAFEGDWLSRPSALADALAAALHAYWAVDPAGCPSTVDLDRKLALARRNVELDDLDADPATFGPGGFAGPEALLRWLEDNRPDEAGVLTHGDFCLPNLFLSPAGEPSYIDVGLSCVGDPWNDIALCWRSFRSNLAGKYGGPVYSGDPDSLFSALGMPKDADKLRYYLLLDELF